MRGVRVIAKIGLFVHTPPLLTFLINRSNPTNRSNATTHSTPVNTPAFVSRVRGPRQGSGAALEEQYFAIYRHLQRPRIPWTPRLVTYWGRARWWG